MGKGLTTNTRLNHYRVRETLGSGGMGTVYRAEVRAALPFAARGSHVALKVLHPHLTEREEFIRRFRREADIGRRIRHPNVVSVFDVDTALVGDTVHHFLVMEFVEGDTLRNLLDELGWVPEELCRHIGVEITKALAAVHEAGAIHRDLKPENILIDQDDRVKLMDLGVAKLVNATTQLSTTGQFVGSMRYAAPEQFRGDGTELDAGVDLHGLGLLLYELSAGRHAFEGADMPVIMNQVMNEAPARLGGLQPQCSAVFEETVHRLLAKRPSARFESAEAVGRILRDGEASDWWIRFLSEEGVRRRARVPAETAFVGREAALGTLSERFRDVSEGRGGVVWITGEAGIGKSRLVDEAGRRAGDGVEILAGAYTPGRGGAVARALRSKFGTRGVEAALHPLLPMTPDLVPPFAAWMKGDIGTPLPRGTLATLVVRTLTALAARAPLALVIEDLHEAPGIGRELVNAVARAAADGGLLLIVTSRAGDAGDLVRLPHVKPIPLSRLSRAEIRGLLVEAFGSETVADELVDPVTAGSGGNPFFLVEIVKTLREAPFLTRGDDGRFSLTGRVSEVRLPDTVTSLLAARLDSLDDADREILDLAACIGSTFEPNLVAEALDRPPMPVLRRLASLEREHGLVRSTGRSYRFDHEQVRERLVTAMPDLLRESCHERLGAVLAARVDADAAEVCRHLLAGRAFEAARPRLDSSIRDLSSRHRHEALVSLTDLALAPAGFLTGAARRDVLERRAESLSILGRRDEERGALEDALSVARAEGDAHAQARIRSHIGRSLIEVSQHDEAETHLLAAIESAKEIGNLRAEGSAEASRGHIAQHRGDLEAARVHFERNHECAVLDGSRQREGAALGNLGLLALDLGRFEEAVERQEQSAAVAREIGDTHGLASALTNGGLALHGLGRLAEARDAFRESLELWRQTGNRQGEGVVVGNLGMVTNELGFMGEALGHYDRQLFLARETGYREGESIAHYNLGSLLIGLGDPEASREHFEAGEAIGEEIGSVLLAAVCRAGRGDALWQSGDLAAAEEAHRNALDRIRAAGIPPYQLKVQIGVARFFAAHGDPREAAALIGESRELATELESPESVLLLSALAAMLPGADAGDAVAHYDAADPEPGAATAIEAAWYLFRATGEARFLADARRHLDGILEGAPEERRPAMVEKVMLYREISEAG